MNEFAEKFLAKCALAEMISKYMVLVESEQKLLIMRPYQIYAVKAILDCVQQNRKNGYIWHTTGSGKTLTSFKAATLLKENPEIEKYLFVVDRKDLDRQTREEFNKFQPGCVEENTNTETLVKRLLSQDYADKVIVATIQRLGLALAPNARKNYKQRLAPLSKKESSLFSTNAIVPSSAKTIRLSKNFSPTPNYLALPKRLFLKKTPPILSAKGKVQPTKPPKAFLKNYCTPIPLPTLSKVKMFYASISITLPPYLC